MVDLSAAGQVIQNQLTASSILSAGAAQYAGVGGIVADGSVTQAQIDQAMLDAYNNAVNTVLTTEYYTASIMLQDQATATLAQLDSAIDDLTAAAATLAIAGAVADLAADAVTAEDNLRVQAAVEVMDPTLSQADVDTYNGALANVEAIAQSAAGFLAASRDASVTGAIDSYAAQNGYSMASYSSVTFSVNAQNMDYLTVTFAGGGGFGIVGFFQGDIKSAEEVWAAGATVYGGS